MKEVFFCCYSVVSRVASYPYLLRLRTNEGRLSVNKLRTNNGRYEGTFVPSFLIINTVLLLERG